MIEELGPFKIEFKMVGRSYLTFDARTTWAYTQVTDARYYVVSGPFCGHEPHFISKESAIDFIENMISKIETHFSWRPGLGWDLIELR